MANSLRAKAAKGLKQGDTFILSRKFTQEETWAFGDLTKDYNPVHYDTNWTEEKGFNGIICHGLLIGGMICEFGGQVGWLATGMNFKFLCPVYFEDEIQCKITLTSLDDNGRAEAEAEFINQEGTKVCLAQLTGRLPMDNEKNILTQMLENGDPTNKLSHKTYYIK